MYNYKIDETMLPTIWLTWASTKSGKFNKRYWLNCKTGVKTDCPEEWMYYPSESEFERGGYRAEGRLGLYWGNRNNEKLWVKSGSAIRFAYVKYHKDIDALEVAAVGVDTTRKEEKHPWKYLGDRFFIFRDKTIKDQNGCTQMRYHLYEGHDAWNPNTLFSMLYRLNYNDNVLNEFKKFIGGEYFTIGNGRCVQIQYLHHLQEWYKTKQKTVGKSTQQDLVNELTSKPLSDVCNIVNPHFERDREASSYYSRYSKIAYFERVDNEWSVIRVFTSENRETYRMYINDSGKDRFTTFENKKWIPSSFISSRCYGYSKFINKDEGIDGCKRIKYAMSVIDKENDNYIINRLFVALKMPELEQLAKLNCQSIVNHVIECTYPKAELKHWAGEYYNEKEKNILKKFGLNRNQLECYAKLLKEGYDSSYYKKALCAMRKSFGNDLSYMDIQSFERYLRGLKNISKKFWYSIENNAEVLSFDAERFTKNLIRLGEKNEQAYSLVNDTLTTARGITYGTLPEVDWYFDDYSDIVRVHDALVQLRNAQNEERRLYYNMSEQERRKKDEEKRIKVDKERKKYEYEDDLYIIRLPKDSSEIITEGSKQSICIGGYTTRHANGETNLFFLREKSNPDKPFYAIEMNRNTIIQIHGFGNKWLGNNPEAIPTVVRWLRKNEISCSKEILTCTARGYGRVNNYVAMPVVD